jgi:predicted metal-dependent hydrolase
VYTAASAVHPAAASQDAGPELLDSLMQVSIHSCASCSNFSDAGPDLLDSLMQVSTGIHSSASCCSFSDEGPGLLDSLMQVSVHRCSSCASCSSFSDAGPDLLDSLMQVSTLTVAAAVLPVVQVPVAFTDANYTTGTGQSLTGHSTRSSFQF